MIALAGPSTAAIGIVVAVNGNIVAADVYASPALFLKLSRKLLDSYALQAVLSRSEAGRSAAAPSVDEALAFLMNAVRLEGTEVKVSATMVRRTRTAPGIVLYEYGDEAASKDGETTHATKTEPVHRAFLKR